MRKALARQAEEKRKFEEAEARLKEAASAAIAENFKNSLANAKLSEAVKSGDPQLIEQAAARKLQSQWCAEAAAAAAAAAGRGCTLSFRHSLLASSNS